jgi:hypothetical protein
MMATTTMRTTLSTSSSLVLLLLLFDVLNVHVSAFTTLSKTTARSIITTRPRPQPQQPSRTRALIYGWDDHDEDDSKPPKPIKFDTSSIVTASSSPSSSSVCESASAFITENIQTTTTDRLARLAFVFRPKEHVGLKLQDIERVHVVCISSNSIELEVILCESLGCVSLHIPIEFPSSCSRDDDDALFQTCVLQHLETLDNDTTTASTIATELTNPTNNQKEDDVAALPSWWISASTTNPAFQAECQTLQDILNESEFQPELRALAQDALNKNAQQQQHSTTTKVVVHKVECLEVGPAGIAMKASLLLDGQNTNAVDVIFPFGGLPHRSPESLRAATLGAIATVSPA